MDQVTFDFSFALLQLKQGNPVTRVGWNGKGMCISLAKTKVMWEHTPLEPFIVMKTVQNKWVPWLASQTDLLSDDWTLYTGV